MDVGCLIGEVSWHSWLISSLYFSIHEGRKKFSNNVRKLFNFSIEKKIWHNFCICIFILTNTPAHSLFINSSFVQRSNKRKVRLRTISLSDRNIVTSAIVGQTLVRTVRWHWLLTVKMHHGPKDILSNQLSWQKVSLFLFGCDFELNPWSRLQFFFMFQLLTRIHEYAMPSYSVALIMTQREKTRVAVIHFKAKERNPFSYSFESGHPYKFKHRGVVPF